MLVTNTLTGRKEEFRPAGDPVRMYVCGPTPYSDTHIGHAMSYVLFDVVKRYLEYRGYRVRHVQNFTDVDDKIIARARENDEPPEALTERYITDFFEAMDELNVRRADAYPRVTREIPAIITMIEGLVEKGYAYPTEDGVYFRVQRFAGYGKLSHRSIADLIAGEPGEVGVGKEHPMDFALWKKAKPGEPFWESPWGAGRPGWHIECSAMAIGHLGPTLDIHGGGQDLIFPHHENEIAQSEAYTGQAPFARYWLHNGFLLRGDDKMSKSLGNLVTAREALERHGPDAVRLFILSSHYRSPLTYSEAILAGHERGARRLRQAAAAAPTGRSPEPAELDPAPFAERFLAAMDDDFNTAIAIAALFDLAREINRAREAGQAIERAQATLRELSGVLGLTLSEPAQAEAAAVEPLIDLLIETRQELRAARQWALADRIRDGLRRVGYVLEDTADGTVWHRAGADD